MHAPCPYCFVASAPVHFIILFCCYFSVSHFPPRLSRAKLPARKPWTRWSTKEVQKRNSFSPFCFVHLVFIFDSVAEQLDRVEKGLDDMNAEMKQAEKHITGMEKWCGLCVCPWSRGSGGKVRDSDAYWKKAEKTGQESGKQAKTKQPAKDSAPAVNGPYVQRITNDAREDEMEENMQEVGNVLGNLKHMAAEMNSEIDKQNKQVDRITAKVRLFFFVYFLCFFSSFLYFSFSRAARWT